MTNAILYYYKVLSVCGSREKDFMLKCHHMRVLFFTKRKKMLLSYGYIKENVMKLFILFFVVECIEIQKRS